MEDLLYDRDFAIKKLRGIVDAIEAKRPLRDIALHFSIPVSLMRRLVMSRHGPVRGRQVVIDDKKLEFLIYGLERGESFWSIAKQLNVSYATLKFAAKRHGISARKLRQKSLKDRDEHAISLYKQGNLSVDDIVDITGIKHATFYKMIKQRGVTRRRPRPNANPGGGTSAE